MPYEAFHFRFPEIAAKETRTITVATDVHVPRGTYGLLEMYCNEPDCDCRRVFFDVYHPERQQSMAIIAYGWENAAFYRAWFRSSMHVSEADIQNMIGPILNDTSPQSKYAPQFLRFIKEAVLTDWDYIERLKRHYEMFKQDVALHLSIDDDDEDLSLPSAPSEALCRKIPRRRRRSGRSQ